MTTANIIFNLLDIEKYSQDDLYRMFGTPEYQTMEIESGQPTGPEAHRYIVRTLDFLSSCVNSVSRHVRVIDFDQSFLVTSPPEKLLGPPNEFLAPAIAVGQPAGKAKRYLGSRLFYISYASRRISLLRI